MNDLIRRLALACCQGWRQEAFVYELLGGGPVYRQAYTFPGPHGSPQRRGWSYGQTRMQSSSFHGLRKRLTAVGFLLLVDNPTNRVTLTFPEEKHAPTVLPAPVAVRRPNDAPALEVEPMTSKKAWKRAYLELREDVLALKDTRNAAVTTLSQDRVAYEAQERSKLTKKERKGLPPLRDGVGVGDWSRFAQRLQDATGPMFYLRLQTLFRRVSSIDEVLRTTPKEPKK